MGALEVETPTATATFPTAVLETNLLRDAVATLRGIS